MPCPLPFVHLYLLCTFLSPYSLIPPPLYLPRSPFLSPTSILPYPVPLLPACPFVLPILFLHYLSCSLTHFLSPLFPPVLSVIPMIHLSLIRIQLQLWKILQLVQMTIIFFPMTLIHVGDTVSVFFYSAPQHHRISAVCFSSLIYTFCRIMVLIITTLRCIMLNLNQSLLPYP